MTAQANRVQVSQALAARVFSATQSDGITPLWQYTARKLVSWDQIPRVSQPAVCVVRMDDKREQQPPQGLPSKLTMHFFLVVYVASDTGTVAPSDQMDYCLDQIDIALAPDDRNRNVFTLGGLVYRCWIEGMIKIAPGDDDGQGMAIVPIHILLP